MKMISKAFTLLILLALTGFVYSNAIAQKQSKSIQMGVSLVKWQTNSPVQIVGSELGDENIVKDVFLFNTSKSQVNKIQFQAVIFDIEKNLSKNTDDFLALESDTIDITVQPLEVVHIKNINLWKTSSIGRFTKSTDATNFIIRLGVLSSSSEDGTTFDSKAKLNSFDKTVAGDSEHTTIDNLWSKKGYNQLITLINKDLGATIAKPKVSTSNVVANEASKCYNNAFDETSWCQATTQTSCRTFECDPGKFCSKTHCWKVMTPILD
jgi:hypothetical protein